MERSYINRRISQNKKWTGKDCKRHKHSFTDPCIVRLTGNENKHIGTSSYTALKCEKCNSFTNLKFVSEQPKGLPVLVFERRILQSR